MTIKNFISERLEETIVKLEQDGNKVRFVLFYEKDVNKVSQSTKEDMANWWSLPYSVNRIISKDKAIESIQFFDSIAPLWIKVSLIKKDLLGLELAQKLRKRKDILNHHNESHLAPFITETPYLNFGTDEQRLGFLAYLTLTLNSTKEMEDYFKETPPKFYEIEEFIKRNFENGFLFFPNNYNHRTKGKPGYSELIIRKNIDNQLFQLINHEFKILTESKTLDDLIKVYLKKELNYKIGKIEIEK